MTRVAELRRVRAEGRAAGVGAVNPYRGELVAAAVWRGGYREMLDAMLASSPARQSWLDVTAGPRALHHPPVGRRATRRD